MIAGFSLFSFDTQSKKGTGSRAASWVVLVTGKRAAPFPGYICSPRPDLIQDFENRLSAALIIPLSW